MKKNIAALGFALTLSMAVLAGCGQDAAETTAAAAPAETTAETTAAAADTTAAETEAAAEAETTTAAAAEGEYQFVTPAEAVAAAKDGSAHVLDVRAWEDYAGGRVADSIWCPIFPLDDDSLVEPMTAFAEANLNDGEEIYIICMSGQKGAQKATGVLQEAGLDASLIYTVEGGAKALNSEKSMTTNRTEENIDWQYVSGTDAVAAVGNADIQILDVRDDATYAEGHLEGSLQVGLKEIEDPAAQTAMYELATTELDKEKPVYILCYSGKNCAKTAISVMKDAGFDTNNLFIIEDGAKNADVQAAFVK